MTVKDEHNRKGNKKDDDTAKQHEKLNVCDFCQNFAELIWVHGHYQCPICKNVVIACCGDE